MARYLGPKVKLSRRVGVPIADIPKHTAKRQLTAPGPHGFRGRRLKDYGGKDFSALLDVATDHAGLDEVRSKK